MENRIIAIDDDQTFLKSIQRALVTSGFKHVTLENNPQKAVLIFKEGQIFDVALIDVSMPGMDGLELIEKIKGCSPQTECIMITGLDEAATAVSAIKKGAYDYLVKPVERDDLILSINRALERKRLFNIADIGKGVRQPELLHKDAFKSIISGSPTVLKILKEEKAGSNGVILHSFTGSMEFLEEALAHNFYISFTGVITFKNTNFIRLIDHVPLKQLLLETDSPFLTPVPFRGKRNEPAYVKYIAEKIAKLKGVPLEELAEITSDNAINLFGLK